MEKGKASATAQAAAALRAAHLFYDEPCVFEDPYAIDMTNDEYRELHRQGRLRATFDDMGLKPIRGQIVGRARYAEDALEVAVKAGIRQYVMLGAGLDAFVLRRPDLMQRLTAGPRSPNSPRGAQQQGSVPSRHARWSRSRFGLAAV